MEKTFADRHKTAKFAKVFSFKSSPLYIYIYIYMTSNCLLLQCCYRWTHSRRYIQKHMIYSALIFKYRRVIYTLSPLFIIYSSSDLLQFHITIPPVLQQLCKITSVIGVQYLESYRTSLQVVFETVVVLDLDRWSPQALKLPLDCLRALPFYQQLLTVVCITK